MITSYLDMVNKVLKRLREPTVSTVSENEYSSLIGEFVNDTKRQVEDSWDWSALRYSLTIDTLADKFNYELAGSNQRMRVLNAYNDTTDTWMQYRPGQWFDQQFMNYDTALRGSPVYFNFNGMSLGGNVGVDVYPIPDGDYVLRINCVVPTDELVEDSDYVVIPSELIVEGAVSRAMAERGVDGGNMDQEARFLSKLSDYIAIDANNRPDELTWSAV